MNSSEYQQRKRHSHKLLSEEREEKKKINPTSRWKSNPHWELNAKLIMVGCVVLALTGGRGCVGLPAHRVIHTQRQGSVVSMHLPFIVALCNVNLQFKDGCTRYTWRPQTGIWDRHETAHCSSMERRSSGEGWIHAAPTSTSRHKKGMHSSRQVAATRPEWTEIALKEAVADSAATRTYNTKRKKNGFTSGHTGFPLTVFIYIQLPLPDVDSKSILPSFAPVSTDFFFAP
jgi:hypothetical protein